MNNNTKELKFHEERRMFCVKEGTLFLAPKGTPDSHATWFMQEGWLSDEPHLIELIPRGYVDNEGNIYFYVGRDFEVDEDLERDFFPFLPLLVEKLDLSAESQVYGGAVKSAVGDKWEAKKNYGSVATVLKNVY